MIQHFWNQFNDKEGMYRVPYGIEYKNDGLWVPYNVQNVHGLCLNEYYRIVGDLEVFDRSKRLAGQFRSEWEVKSEGRAVWHYHSSYWYGGWSESDRLSLNNPSRIPTSDGKFEDVSHAGLNVKYVLDCCKRLSKRRSRRL